MSINSFSDFKDDLYNAINDQIRFKKIKFDTWSALNRRHQHDSIMKKGSMSKTIMDADAPIIDVYIDRSGSWYDSDVQKGLEALAMLNEFEEAGQVVINKWYFSAILTQDAAEARDYSAGTRFDLCLDHLRKSGANNVVVITDSDSNSYIGNESTIDISGHVW